MDEVESLSSILTNSEPPAVEVKTEATPEVKTEVTPEVKTEATRDEQGRFTAPEVKTEAKDEKPEISRRDIAGIIDERKKRQELEAKLKQYETQKPKTDFYEDPDKAFTERLQDATAPLQQKFFKLSMKAAERSHTDFQDVAEVFAEATKHDPQLIAAMRDADDPGEYIYSIGLQLRELSDVGGDFAKYREKVTGELKADLGKRDEQIKALMAENEALKKSKAELESIPRSLNKGTESAPRHVAEADDDDIKSIVRFSSTKR